MGIFDELHRRISPAPECLPGCQGCSEFIQRLRETSPEAVRFRFNYLPPDDESMGPIRTCVKDAHGNPVAVCDAAIEGRQAEIGILRDPSFGSKGAADEAYAKMVPILGRLGVGEIRAHVANNNHPSQNFLTRNGFVPDLRDMDGRRDYTIWTREL